MKMHHESRLEQSEPLMHGHLRHKEKLNMKKRKPLKKPRHSGANDSELMYLEYEITDEPITDGPFYQLPKSVQKRLEKLHYDIPRNPGKALPELLELKKKYPEVPQIYNYLTVAYTALEKRVEAEAISRECMQKHPDYLFARLHMGQIYLSRGEYEKVPELFQHKYDLGLLYPNRKVFHITEVVGFMGLMGLYFVRKDQPEIAQLYNEILQKIAPDAPVTKRLSKELNFGLLQDLFEQVLRKKPRKKK